MRDNPHSAIPNPKSLRVLILEDRPADAELMVAELRRQGFDPDWTRVETETDFVAALDERLDVILSDFNLPTFDALQAIAHVRRRALTVPVIVVTGAVGEETAARCIREGAADYLLKDRLARLGLAVEQAVERRLLADQRREIESALAASQHELTTVFDSAPVAMVIINDERRVVRTNRAASRLAGRPPGDAFGRRPGDVFGCLTAAFEPDACRDETTCRECPLRLLVSETIARRVERHGVECTLPFGGRDGPAQSTFLVSSSPIETPAGVLAVVSLEDITERQRGRDRERRLARLLATIRDVNQLIVRETSRDVILAESCRIIVENAGFQLAWVGEADHTTGFVRPVAVAGDPAMSEALGRVSIHWDDDGPEAGPIATAIRERRTVVVADSEVDPTVARWRAQLREAGFRSGASLPLVVTGHAFGALTVYGRHPDEFDDEVIDLLDELADDLGFALSALETADRREAAERALVASEERYRSVFEQAPIGIYRTTAEGRVVAANPALIRMLGYDSLDELAAIDVGESGFASPEGQQAFRDALGPDGEVVGHHAEWRTRDGESVFVRENARAICDADGGVLYYEGTVEDITEAHRTRRERDLLYDLAVDMFCISGFDGRLRQLNPAWQSNLGWSLDDLCSTSFLSFIHPDDREMALAAYAELGAGRTVLANENRVRCRDGSYRWLSWNAHPLPDEGLIVAVAHDTTERRRAEQDTLDSLARLEEANEKLSLLVEGSPHYFFYLQDLDASVTFVSPSVSRITGRPAADWLGQHHWFVTDNPINQAARETTHRHLTGDFEGRPIRVEVGRPDGTAVLLEVVESGRFRGNELIGLQGVAHDVTAQFRAEQAVKESEQRYREFFEDDLTADFITELDGTLVECNPAYVRIFGFADKDDARATNVAELYASPDGRSRLLARLEEGDGRLEGVELELQRRDGSPLFVIGNLGLVTPGDGGRSRIKGYLFDVTERRELEGQLRQSQKMEAVGRLAGGVAHDFNNLLQALLSQTQLIRTHDDDALHLDTITDEIEQQVRRGAALTRQLLLFSRRETTQLAALDLNQVVRNQVSLLRRLIRANITLDLELAPEELPVTADHGQLEQVLMNLVVNASDVLPAGGGITIRSGHNGSAQVWFTVEDNGPGVPVDLRAKIFEPFFTTKAAVEGTGLGLSVVHGIVTQHGATIAVDDRPGGGTVFTVSLPRAAPETGGVAKPIQATAPAVVRGRHERVLVVEDEAATREGLADLLDALDYDVVAVGSAEEVSSLPDSPPFDVLLTDMMLPGASGPELAAAARLRWPELTVLLMSGYNENEIVRRGVDAGTIRFLQKPFDMRTLASELRAALDEGVGIV
jgi:PAS domain S-box-containing protein